MNNAPSASSPCGRGRTGLLRVACSRANRHPCPIRAQCTTSAPHTARTRMQAEQDTPEWREAYQARAGIEGTVSQAVRGPVLRGSRYQGLAKTHLQNVLIGMAINIRRLGAHYDTTTRTDRRPTRVHALCTRHGITTAPDTTRIRP
ncbi:transposase [Kitasatospora aureofaciens]|uniref:transposase n=1 Tax=Kitasatospora aureofaciens TaxID=1894 RepID=UPI0033FAC600